MSPNFQLFLFPFYLLYFSKFSKAAVITIYFFSFAYPLNVPHSNSSRYNKFTFPFPVDCSKDQLSENLSSPFISSPSDEKSEKIYAGNRIVVMDLQRMLVGRFVRNVIPTRRLGVQIRARFIAPWWKKCTVIKHATRHLSRGQNGRDVSFSPLPE